MSASKRKNKSDDSFVFIDPTDILSINLSGDTSKDICSRSTQSANEELQNQVSPISKRTEPLSLQRFQEFIDTDGRLVDESSLRRTVFLGGVEPSARREVWQYLFALYPCSSTKREREVLLLDYIVKYNEMKSRWKTLLVLSAQPGATKFEQGLVARYQLDDSQSGLLSPDLETSNPLANVENYNHDMQAVQTDGLESDFNTLSKNCEFLDFNSEETKQKIEFMKIQAQVYVNRCKIDVTGMKSYLRLIDKDVPRTDRDVPYFKESKSNQLSMLRDILITYATFHSDVGYAQGMNDILARFLFIFDSEVEAFWCFHNYLDKIKNDFLEEGMIKKIELVRKLLLEMDPLLLEHLQRHDLGDLLFCHRWLLLGFKREFSFMDSLRVFEILSSHHLELSSVEAETAKRKQAMKEFVKQGGVTRTEPIDTDAEYTFELFMCVALLETCRERLFRCYDAAMVFDCINHLEINLDSILEKSEHLFFRYCKKTVENSFQIVDTPVVNR
ncbi:TBC1 domain family member 15-like [Mercenaria mercenaria]|uniref:TBC1 domain family member 15-like n=1 Tax=Mercenaria mercenaria TaxID=6596 RepID=UPI00234F0301|nr:TBC1 domain family member 15-like [Mercenaria mercenaria]XP_053379006.1 TBC1 domain family member 15-like [Mercenaria mercenaria]